MPKHILDRVVTQGTAFHDLISGYPHNTLHVQVKDRAAWCNVNFTTPLPPEDLEALGRIISREVRSAYRMGLDAAWEKAIERYETARAGDEEPDWDEDWDDLLSEEDTTEDVTA
jgi:hypothetical protein